jgi:hypothetical protein
VIVTNTLITVGFAGDPNSALAKHRAFLKMLETRKIADREDQMLAEKLGDLKTANFKQRAADQREKINQLKGTDELIEEAQAVVDEQPEPVKSEKAPSEKPKAKKAAKPAWATTEKQQEDFKEAEIDDLLEFAYELDYEKYMEDFEVRQALAVIKERVVKIKEEPDWKEKMAEEWNQA